MSYQSKIAAATSKLKRKLRDHSVSIAGDDVRVIRLKITENQYGDETITIVDHDDIVIVLDIPEGIPLDRLRVNLSEPVTTTESIFLFDILPIIGYAQFEDNVEKGDVLVFKMYDEDDEDNGTNYTLILRVSEILGNFSHGRISGRRFQCAPHNIILPTEVQDIINTYNASS